MVRGRALGTAEGDGTERGVEPIENISDAMAQRSTLHFARRWILCLQLTPQNYRQPFFVRLNHRTVFGVAAVWDRWVSDDDDVIESCSIIHVPANELVSSLSDLHHDMPCILRRKHYEGWLHGKPAEAQALLQGYRADWMHAYPVSPRVDAVVAG